MQPIFRTQLIWARIAPANSGFGASIPFPDQPILAGCYVVGAESVSVDMLTFTPDQTPVTPTPADYSVSWAEGSDFRHEDVPVTELIAQLNGGVWKEYTPFVCDFQKSRVTRRGTGLLAADEAVAFTIYYFTPDDLRNFDALMLRLRGQ